MEKQYLILGFVVLLLASAFMIGPTKTLKSYDDVVDISSFLNEGDSIKYPENATVIKSSSSWHPAVNDLNKLTRMSQVILTGTVREIKDSKKVQVKVVEDSNDTMDYIYTDIVVDVDSYTKKQKINESKTIIVRNDGGCVENLCYESEDAPSFKVGEKVFLLLISRDIYTKDIGDKHYRVLGGMFGKFSVSDGYGIREKLPKGQRVYKLDDLSKLARENKDILDYPELTA
jgi:hypothetical protein